MALAASSVAAAGKVSFCLAVPMYAFVHRKQGTFWRKLKLALLSIPLYNLQIPFYRADFSWGKASNFANIIEGVPPLLKYGN